MNRLDPFDIINKTKSLLDVLSFIKLGVYTNQMVWFISKENGVYLISNEDDINLTFSNFKDIVDVIGTEIITELDLFNRIDNKFVNLYLCEDIDCYQISRENAAKKIILKWKDYKLNKLIKKMKNIKLRETGGLSRFGKTKTNIKLIKLISIKKSTKKDKKLMATFETNGKSARVKVIHFGSAGMSDLTKHRDKSRKKRYISRHHKDLRTKNPMRAGYLSMFILWNKTSLKASIADYRRRLGVYNRTGKFPIK